MKRILTSVFALLVMVSVAGADPQYGWTISASNVDPMVNTATLAPFTTFAAYLWIFCNVEDGFAATDFGIDVQNAANFGGPVSFATLNNWINQSAFPDMILVPGGCQNAPALGGSFGGFWLGSAGASALCFRTHSTSGNLGTIDCDAISPVLWPQQGIGLGINQPSPCREDLCTVVSVDTQTWGNVKSLYR